MPVEHTSFEPLGFFMLRRPLLSQRTMLDFHEKVGDRWDLCQKELMALFSSPLLSDAIYLASSSLYRSLSDMITGQSPQADRALTRALYKYLIRICTRSTPFGFFSGFSVGIVSHKTQITFTASDELNRYLRLHPAVASELGAVLNARPVVLAKTRYFVNSSLYVFGRDFRFVEKVHEPASRTILLASLSGDRLLKRVLAVCENGCPFEEIVQKVSSSVGADHAAEYVTGLINMQVLVSELEMHVTGPEYLQKLLQLVGKIPAARGEQRALKKIRNLLSAPGPLENICQRLTAILEKQKITCRERILLQADLNLRADHCTLNRQTIQLLSKEFEKIGALYAADSQNSDLQRFKQDFFHRYQNQEISLLHALDAESGLGYGSILPGRSQQSTLLKNLEFPQYRQEEIVRDDALADFKRQLLDRADTEQVRSISLSDADLDMLKDTAGRRPGYFYWLGSIICSQQQQFDQGNFHFLLRAVGGSSGLELFGRFCQADPALYDFVQESAKARQDQQEVVFAEIAHLPGAESGAVLSRPNLSEYEIVYLAASALPSDKQILASDLMVSVQDGKQLIIRSRRLNKRIIPLLTSAHNFSTGVPVYRFLCEVGSEQQPYRSWNWGQFSTREFLPRLSYGHLVIARATWNLEKGMFSTCDRVDDEFLAAWNSIRSRLGIPRYVQVCQFDQELFIDCRSRISLEILREIIQKAGKARIVETLQQPSEGFLDMAAGTYAHEVVIPFRPEVVEPALQARRRAAAQQTRRFVTGSCWLYMKIYVGTTISDKLLVEEIGPYCEKLVNLGKLQKWFFVRYQDPDHHLRLRFYHGNRPGFWRRLLTDLHSILKGWMDSGLIQNVQTDVYDRELERYAGMDYERVESIFHADSQAVVALLTHLDQQSEDNDRWLIALAGADTLMNDMGLTTCEKHALVTDAYQYMLEEFGAGLDFTRQLDRQYRSHSEDINAYLSEAPNEVLNVFARRAEKIRMATGVPEPVGRLPADVISSCIHMFFNRVFCSAPRHHELVMYHYLNKYYKSLISREKMA